MGDDLWATRLRWYGYSGCARLDWHHVQLETPPIIRGISVACIDYIPEIGMRLLQPVNEKLRDMNDDEVAAADALLREVAGCRP